MIVIITVVIALYSIKGKPNLDLVLFLINRTSPVKKQMPDRIKTIIKKENEIETIVFYMPINVMVQAPNPITNMIIPVSKIRIPGFVDIFL